MRCCLIFTICGLVLAGYARESNRLAAFPYPDSPSAGVPTPGRLDTIARGTDELDRFELMQAGDRDLLDPAAADPDDPDAGTITAAERNRTVLWTTGIGVAGITVWGIINWDYFSARPHAADEGWFGYNRKHGGADKLGHAYTSYLATHIFAALYERAHFSKHDAAVYGTLTSFIIMGYMEFGDSFSEGHGFSIEDFIVNTVGCALGYVTWRYPNLRRKIDFRWEYGFHPYDLDVVTDYENSKFLLAIRLNGWDCFQDSVLRHLEFHVGYYTRGYGDDDDDETDRERTFYLGIGINITDFLRRRGHKKTATFFNYYQLPYTYYPYEWSYDD